jgi:DNA polymerase-3 subunit delta'
LPHAWLISGPQGVGKATFAYRIARFLPSQPMQAEAVCRRHQAGGATACRWRPATASSARSRSRASDFRSARRTPPNTGRMRKDIVIEDVRAVIDFLHLKPALTRGAW